MRKNEGETICSLNFAQRVRNVELGAATRRFENGDMVEVCIMILLNKHVYINSKVSKLIPLQLVQVR